MKKVEIFLKKSVDKKGRACYINWAAAERRKRELLKSSRRVPWKLNIVRRNSNVSELKQNLSTSKEKGFYELVGNKYKIPFWDFEARDSFRKLMIILSESWLWYHFLRVWSWLRTNAGGMPNTCKSNEAPWIETSVNWTGDLVADGWVMHEQPASEWGTTVGNDC